jgi:magnesium chelatase subunit H
MPKRTSAADQNAPMRVTIVTLDGHLASAADRAFNRLRRSASTVSCSLHCAGEWTDAQALQRCLDDIASANILIVCMLFMEDHIKAVLPALQQRRDDCDAMLCFMSAGEVMKLTRIGGFAMDGKQSGPMALLRKLRGSPKKAGSSSGAGQLAMIRRLPRILRFIPGTAQDLRVYFLGMQYWLAGSETNIRNLVALVVTRYARGPRAYLRNVLKVADPIEYPEVGVYHPALADRVTDSADALPHRDATGGTVGLLLMRSYVLAGNTRHYDAVIAALESHGLRVIPVFASGLDARPAVDRFFSGRNKIDAFVSLTGFSLVGGPAYNDAAAAANMLAGLDTPYFAAHSSEFQSLETWKASEHGLLPVETTMMVAIPELDGAICPTLYAGRSAAGDRREMHAQPDQIATLADRVQRRVSLRQTDRANRRIAIVLFNFPPNGGAVGSAAHLSVFRSLYNTLSRLRAEGYDVELPEDEMALQSAIVDGNASGFGADANVHAQIGVDDYVARQPWLADIEAAWGPAPGKHQSDGASIQVLGRQFGNVFVGVQPAFGYEGDPMRLLFEKGLAPTHAFAAFYQYLRDDFDADAVLHFGTHGALEFMPGKQAGLSADCWPERLIANLPNFYLYAANNPSEATIAKRRSGAMLISYLTPTITRAGLYRELSELQASIDRWRTLDLSADKERRELVDLIHSQATDLELEDRDASWHEDPEDHIAALTGRLEEVRSALIPHGLHVVGEAPSAAERAELLDAILSSSDAQLGDEERAAMVADVMSDAEGDSDDERLSRLRRINRKLQCDAELDAIVHALDGGYIAPVAGGDLMRSEEILPTGRNIHGFDPFRLPSTFAVRTGAAQADDLVARFEQDNGRLPESVAVVLWGSDNIKSEGASIGQALRLMGAEPRFDGYGRLTGAQLIPLEQLDRPRIDVVMTLSGIFRDLLPQQTQMLAEAAWLAASADEPCDRNFIRKHVLEYQRDCDCDLETAALRVFSNAVGAYGSNVNHVIESGHWNDEDELANQYSQRKCFAYGRSGSVDQQSQLLERSLADVDFAYQNLESAELGVTSIDHYFDTLGGISKAVERARGNEVEVYIGDQSGPENVIRTLSDQVALETRTRILNPRWYEGLLDHGFEGVRQIESHVTNTMGWSATTGKVAPWVYERITQTYMLDPEMRERLAQLNPAACAKVANRLLEAYDRKYWSPDEETLAALERAGEEIEDHIEGVAEVAA